MNNPHKAFLETCSAAIGATGLHPRERLTFLVIAWLCDNGDYVPRKEICKHTGIKAKHLNPVLASLEQKGLIVLNVGAKPAVEIQQSFNKTPMMGQDTNNGCEDTNNGSNTNNGYEKTNNGCDFARFDINLGKTDRKVGCPPCSPLSSSSPDPSIINPPYNPPTECAKTDPVLSTQTENEPVEELQLEGEVLKEQPSGEKAFIDEQFELFWKLYPRKVQKQLAKKRFIDAVKAHVSPATIIEGLKKSRKTFSVEKKYIPYPSTWLNDARWEDDDKVLCQPGSPEKKVEASFSEDEKAFLDVYGKKPHSQEDIDLFHTAFERAMKELEQDIKLLCAAATIAIDVQTQAEGDTRRMKRASYWLDDCEYRQYLTRARSSATYRIAVSGKTAKSYWDIRLVD